MNIDEYVNKALLDIFNIAALQKEYTYDSKTNVMKLVFDDFHWIHYTSFVDSLHRLLRHKFGKDTDKYFGISVKVGHECRHNNQLLLYIKFGIDIDTLAGYLRIMNGGNDG